MRKLLSTKSSSSTRLVVAILIVVAIVIAVAIGLFFLIRLLEQKRKAKRKALLDAGQDDQILDQQQRGKRRRFSYTEYDGLPRIVTIKKKRGRRFSLQSNEDASAILEEALETKDRNETDPELGKQTVVCKSTSETNQEDVKLEHSTLAIESPLTSSSDIQDIMQYLEDDASLGSASTQHLVIIEDNIVSSHPISISSESSQES